MLNFLIAKFAYHLGWNLKLEIYSTSNGDDFVREDQIVIWGFRLSQRYWNLQKIKVQNALYNQTSVFTFSYTQNKRLKITQIDV